MTNSRGSKNIVAFGEIYSSNIGDGIIFECLKHGMAERGVNILPGDLSLREGYASNDFNTRHIEVSPLRKLSRYFVRRSLTLRRIITLMFWIFGERRKFIDRFENIIRSSDGVIIGGGQILVDRQFAFPLRIFTIVNIAKSAGKPIAVFSCGADANQGPLAKCIFRRMTRYAVYLSVRDRTSADFLSPLGTDLTVHVHPDIAFLAPHVFASKVGPAERTIGINLIPYETVAAFSKGLCRISRIEYIDFWRDLIKLVAERGWSVKLTTNGDTNDTRSAHEIYSPFKSDSRVQLVPPPSSPGDLVSTIQSVDALIASRMHAGIVAYSFGKRVAPMVWDKKVAAVWSEVDPAVQVFNFDALALGRRILSDIEEYMLKATDAESADSDRFDTHGKLKSRLDRSLDELAGCFST